MVVVQASKIPLPSSSPSSSFSSSTAPTSVLFEPTSLSLALTHSDSSLSLFPSLSPFPSLSSLPSPQTLIPPPSTSSIFLLLRQASCSAPHVLFIVAGPHRGGSQILLRFYALHRDGGAFTRPRIVCKQKGLTFQANSGVSVDFRHGLSVKLSGSVNFFSMYSISSSKVWVFAVKIAPNGTAGEDGSVLKLMKCAVIECCRPVWSICVAFGLMIFGEENGIRVFNLWSIAKVHDKKVNNMTSNLKSGTRGSRLPLGSVGENASKHSENSCHRHLEGKADKHFGSSKQKALKLKQAARVGHAYFIEFEKGDAVDLKFISKAVASVKATHIQAVSPETFMVLDSGGDLHLLCLPKSKWSSGSKFDVQLKPLPHIMKVQHLAALPDSSMRAETVWISDGLYSVHIIAGCGPDTANGENDENDAEKRLRHISVEQAIFTSEKIQALLPVSSNGTLILGQGSMYAYTIS
ncbi:hypothetical protein SAY86_019871 [Trapa natans]|uniref:Uncharacterized protein n=1 Tax=Trapa natans TaxID=22666 RepID=A0AAN7R3M8_TRANT|nr:hypothetical protein SAY86_019871 [Trapa natans]